MKTVRILIADDHEIVREGIRSLLAQEPNWEVCGLARNGRDAVEQAEKLRPDIVILDLEMPEVNGLDAAHQIKRRVPNAELLMFTAHEREELIREVFEAGVRSYILKGDRTSRLVEAVEALSRHKPFLTTKVAEVLFAKFLDDHGQQHGGARSAGELTVREREIVRLLAEGRSNKEVAQALGISVRTVETHRASLLRKLGLSSLADLVRYAIRNKIAEP